MKEWDEGVFYVVFYRLWCIFRWGVFIGICDIGRLE